jgi:hypothetical protein
MDVIRGLDDRYMFLTLFGVTRRGAVVGSAVLGRIGIVGPGTFVISVRQEGRRCRPSSFLAPAQSSRAVAARRPNTNDRWRRRVMTPMRLESGKGGKAARCDGSVGNTSGTLKNRNPTHPVATLPACRQTGQAGDRSVVIRLQITMGARSKPKKPYVASSAIFTTAKKSVTCEPRAVKRRPKPYPLLNKPCHQFREIGHRSRYKRLT